MKAMLTRSLWVVLAALLLSGCPERRFWSTAQYGDRILWCRDGGLKVVPDRICYDSPPNDVSSPHPVYTAPRPGPASGEPRR